MVRIKCPNCNALLGPEKFTNTIYCRYCGRGIVLDALNIDYEEENNQNDSLEVLFKYEPRWITKDSPVMIASICLFQNIDNQMRAAEIIITNISSKTIKECEICLKFFDSKRNLIAEKIGLCGNLSLKPGDCLNKRTKWFEDSVISTIEAMVVRVTFSEGGEWTSGKETSWYAVKKQKMLKEYFSKELLEEYLIETGSDCKYVPAKHDDLFLCTCGTVNRDTEECIKCGKTYKELKQNLNQQFLISNKEKRVHEIGFDRYSGDTATDSVKYLKKEKRKSFFLAIIIIIGIAIALFWGIPTVQYSRALNLYNQGYYDAARAYFIKLDGFRYANAMNMDCLYKRAEQLFKDGEYDKAISYWKKIPKYSDSAERLLGARYYFGIKLKSENKYEEAVKQFQLSNGYEDAEDQIQLCYNEMYGAVYGRAKRAVSLKNYKTAQELFRSIRQYKDSNELYLQATYDYTKKLIERGDYNQALQELNDSIDNNTKVYKNNISLRDEVLLLLAEADVANNDYSNAAKKLEEIYLSNYSIGNRISNIYYEYGKVLYSQENYCEAMEAFNKAGNYSNSKDLCTDSKYRYACQLLLDEKYDSAISMFKEIENYKDSKNKIKEAEEGLQ